MTHVVAIIPAKNSVDSVAATVTALIETGAVGEVLVVDDGSVDGTGESAAKAGARVVGLDSNIGKGGAVAAGIAADSGRGWRGQDRSKPEDGSQGTAKRKRRRWWRWWAVGGCLW